MEDLTSPTVEPTGERSHCVACFEPIHTRARICPHCRSSQTPERWHSLGLGLKWLGGITAVISLVAGALQLNELLQTARERTAAVDNLVRAADLQMQGGDLENALLMVQEALELDPASAGARDLQAKAAAATVRDFYGFDGRNHRDALDPVMPILHRGAASTDAALAADMLAHIGWANHLRGIESDIRPAVQTYFERAFELDPDNVFAHTFWANWCLTNHHRPDCGDNLETAVGHYEVARKSGLHQDYVSDVASFTLYATSVDGANLHFVAEVARSLREGQSPDEKIRKRIRSELSRFTSSSGQLQELLARVAPRDLLAVVDWATESDLGKRANWPDVALRGFLQESAGETQQALKTFRAVRLMIRQEETRRRQRGYTKLRARIDLRLAKLLNVRPGWLGIKQQELTEALAQTLGLPEVRGVFVAEVTPGGPAQQAGIRAGDAILAIQGREIRIGRRGDVLEDVHVPSAGDEVEILLFRDGQQIRVHARLGQKDLSAAATAPTFGDMDTAFARLLDKTLYGTQVLEFADGELVVADLRDDLRNAFEAPQGADGVLVFDGWDRDKPLISGDLVRQVEGQPVKNVAEFRAAIQQAAGGDAPTVLINRLRRGRAEVVPLTP